MHNIKSYFRSLTVTSRPALTTFPLVDLVETGVIEEFSVILKPAMVDSDYLVALLYTDGSENEEEFMEKHYGDEYQEYCKKVSRYL